jgi:hypothetical protein
MKAKTCEQHEVCQSSDSQLAICLCWCAECADIMEDNRKALKLADFSQLMSIYGATVEKQN